MEHYDHKPEGDVAFMKSYLISYAFMIIIDMWGTRTAAAANTAITFQFPAHSNATSFFCKNKKIK